MHVKPAVDNALHNLITSIQHFQSFNICEFFFVQFNFAQNTIKTSFIKKTPLHVDKLVNVDNFQTLFYLDNNVIHKKNSLIDYTYNNLQLGTATSANAFNPLKINLFYQDLNTVIILDNRLAEIFTTTNSNDDK